MKKPISPVFIKTVSLLSAITLGLTPLSSMGFIEEASNTLTTPASDTTAAFF